MSSGKRQPSRDDLTVVECPMRGCGQLLGERSTDFRGVFETVCPRCRTKVAITADDSRILLVKRR